MKSLLIIIATSLVLLSHAHAEDKATEALRDAGIALSKFPGSCKNLVRTVDDGEAIEKNGMALQIAFAWASHTTRSMTNEEAEEIIVLCRIAPTASVYDVVRVTIDKPYK